jgi:hypothetical protein
MRHTLLICCLLLSPVAFASIVLENALWGVELDPATLAIRVTPNGQAPVQASSGVPGRAVSQFEQNAQQASWQWDDGAFQVSARLEQRDLALSITAREAGELPILVQPASALGKGLMWPLAEGHYVPSGNAPWQAFLLEQGDINTTQDLSLPLWGVDHGAFTLNWLLTNPYNNRLRWQGQALSLAHGFTSLVPGAPMTLLLHLGESDPLAGARRYRQWLIEQGRYEPLADKLSHTPEAQKLLGASHVYLWGNDLLAPGDVRDWPLLLKRLRAHDLKALLDKEAAKVLAQTTTLNRYEKSVLLRALNVAINQKARQSWQVDEPDMTRLAARYGELRSALAMDFAGALSGSPETWGSQVVQALREAGLPRLMVTLGEGWEGGLWHPETIRAGVDAGYLMAPYDSYQTALSATENPDWTTAHLGSMAYRDCAIVLQDGKRKSGFQQSGHYTDPRCVRPLLEARVQAVQARAGFNAWFLDAYATSMLFDSYRDGAPMTQAQNAEANNDASRWLNRVLQLPTGSEDGNALTAQGILFAHGMQTPVLGWGDHEMSQNKQSRYYVGNWYPPEQPTVFFKPVPLNEPFRTIYFDPTLRLPLYQAVFHGSVITTHHWLFDSLKLSNVRAENELAQLLYNVPPLYHLSAATLKERLPLIQRQDRFFRPLHQRLATQAMTGFRWLTADRQVQETTFADGTRLVANFSAEAKQGYAAWSVTALVDGEKNQVYQLK